MGSWQVTEQAVAAMNNISKQLQNIAAKIHSETETIKSAFEENHDGMGAHSVNIQALIEDVEGTEQDAAIPVQKLVLKLQRAALVRKRHIESNRYGSRSPVSRDVRGTQIASRSGNKAADKTAFRKKIDAEGQRAVRLAWKREKELVLQGKGTRDWTVSQQQELLSRNPPRISGFEGQHMFDKTTYPEYAGDPNNIQWLTYEEHFFGAHQENFPTSTNGYFDTKTGKLIPFKKGEKPSVPIIELTDKYKPCQEEFVSHLGRDFGYGRYEDHVASKERHKGEKSNRHFGKSG